MDKKLKPQKLNDSDLEKVTGGALARRRPRKINPGTSVSDGQEGKDPLKIKETEQRR